MTIIYGKSFLKSAKKLPFKGQKKLADLIFLLQKNPFNPLLHTKSLSGPLSGLYSFRITRDWRVIFQFLDENTIKLLLVGHRKDIYQ
jgi:toxin YoeB